MQFESLRRPCYHGWHAKSGDLAASAKRYPGFLVSECFRGLRVIDAASRSRNGPAAGAVIAGLCAGGAPAMPDASAGSTFD
jgi:hypothetical protein